MENAKEGPRVSADAMQVEPTLVAPIVAVPLLVVLLAGVLVRTRRRDACSEAFERSSRLPGHDERGNHARGGEKRGGA